METPVTGDARVFGIYASICGQESAIAAGDEDAIELTCAGWSISTASCPPSWAFPWTSRAMSSPRSTITPTWPKRTMPRTTAGCMGLGPTGPRPRAEIRRVPGRMHLRGASAISPCGDRSRPSPRTRGSRCFQAVPRTLLVQRYPKSGTERRVAVAPNFAPEERAFPLSVLVSALSPWTCWPAGQPRPTAAWSSCGYVASPGSRKLDPPCRPSFPSFLGLSSGA